MRSLSPADSCTRRDVCVGRREDEARRYLEQLCSRNEFGSLTAGPGDLPSLDPRLAVVRDGNRVEARLTAAGDRVAQLEQRRGFWSCVAASLVISTIGCPPF